MLSEQATKNFFAKYFDINENTICFDCKNRSAKWASVTNGIIICLNCAGIHRGLGVQVSFVRSTIIDNWNERQLSFMKYGGNEQLNQFLAKYSIPQTLPQEYKYKTKAAWYYRKKLLSKVENIPFDEEPPTIEEGAQIIEFEMQVPQVQEKSLVPISPPSEDLQNHKQIKKQQKSKENNQQKQLKDDIKNIGSNVYQKTKKLGNQGKEIAKKGMKQLSQVFHFSKSYQVILGL